MYRQGDVLLSRVASLPAGRKLTEVKPKNGRHILAYGEVTGHHHSIAANRGKLFKDETGATFLEIAEALQGVTELEHQEHDPIALAPGVYGVEIQREYSPEEIRSVAD